MHQEDVNVFFRSGNMSRDKEMVEVVKKEENSRRLDDASRLLLHHVVMFQILVFAVPFSNSSSSCLFLPFTSLLLYHSINTLVDN